MKKILLLVIGLTLFSCSTPEMDQAQQVVKQQEECGTIYDIEFTPNGAELYVKFTSESHLYLLTHQVEEPYYKGDVICDFSGMTMLK